MASDSLTALTELLARPRENLDIEIKEWLDLKTPEHKSDLAKAVIALTNHGGGFLLLGLREDDGGSFSPAPNRPETLSDYSQDVIQNVLQKYLDPPIQCHVHHLENPTDKLLYPVVVIPGGQRIPIRAKVGSPDGKFLKHKIYIRRPGPRSEEPQDASEWDTLLERCLRARRDDLLESIRDILSGHSPKLNGVAAQSSDPLIEFETKATQRWEQLVGPLPENATPRLPHGFYEVGAQIFGDIKPLSLAQMRETISRARKDHSGWAPFPIINRDPYQPALVDNTIEAWFGPDTNGTFDTPAHCDFWRISKDGQFFTRKGFDEDGRFKGMAPGISFDITTPTWRLGEIFLQLHYIGRAITEGNSEIRLHVRWNGLSGRSLISLGNPRRTLSIKRVARQNEFTYETVTTIERLNVGLPDIVFDALRGVYELFDFFELPKRIVEEELSELRTGIF